MHADLRLVLQQRMSQSPAAVPQPQREPRLSSHRCISIRPRAAREESEGFGTLQQRIDSMRGCSTTIANMQIVEADGYPHIILIPERARVTQIQRPGSSCRDMLPPGGVGCHGKLCISIWPACVVDGKYGYEVFHFARGQTYHERRQKSRFIVMNGDIKKETVETRHKTIALCKQRALGRSHQVSTRKVLTYMDGLEKEPYTHATEKVTHSHTYYFLCTVEEL